MRQLLASRGFTIAAFMVATLSLTAWLYNAVSPFSSYRWLYGGLVPWAGPGGVFGILGFLAGLSAATVSCMLDAPRRAGTPLHRFDYFFAVVVWFTALSLVAGFYEKGRTDAVWHIVCLGVLAVMSWYLWATTVVRLRAGTLRETVLWWRVFRTLPLNQFSGIFILAVVVIASALLLFGAQQMMHQLTFYSSWQDLRLTTWIMDWVTAVGWPALSLAAVAILSLNIVSITAAKERAVEARLSEERFRAELITNVTHDLRTPLTSIVSYADLIGKLDLDDPTLAEYSAVLGRKAERLRGLIGDLLDASRASAGNLPVRLETLELTEIVGQIAGDFDDLLTTRELTWVGPPPGHAFVRADGEHLWRILENLVGNIAKYAKPGTCVHADIVRLPTAIQLRLSNLTAEPIPVSAEQLTAQFVRGDVARHSEGSGLGLFIADRLAKLMGASLAVSVEGDHFAATVELRAADAPQYPPVRPALQTA